MALAGAAPARAASLVVGAAAPPLTLTTLDGAHIDTQSLRGKVVILTFWATWCDPCREELPLLSRFYERHHHEGLEVLGFSLDGSDDLQDVRQVARTLQFPVGLLGSAYAGGYGRVWHLPVNFTIDRQGRLADNGWTDDSPTWTEERLQRVVAPLLEKS
jgi:peroxiredoxin